ncbi:group II intron maturase-specific domain-containing protein [Symbiopectobacterium sp. RP]|uniref:group II intron maturase-specific domain-containing protein n=1 Tax=Symbiopectobacterium sp. RP TaxID=3248553 RepID=UPI003D294C23
MPHIRALAVIIFKSVGYKSRLREITGRSKGRTLEQVIGKLRVYLTGWRNYSQPTLF